MHGLHGTITSHCIYIFVLSSVVRLDAISETNPRVIDDTRARKLAADLKRCSYYETCATYGLNVDRVFQDGKRNRTELESHILVKKYFKKVSLIILTTFDSSSPIDFVFLLRLFAGFFRIL